MLGLVLMCLVFEENIEGQLDLFICESAALLTANNASKLLCGLRGGTVIAFDVKWERCRFKFPCFVRTLKLDMAANF